MTTRDTIIEIIPGDMLFTVCDCPDCAELNQHGVNIETANWSDLAWYNAKEKRAGNSRTGDIPVVTFSSRKISTIIPE